MKRITLVKAFTLVLLSLATQAQDPAAPPPSAPPPKSAAELEKLVAPIALFSDPLIATILPASVYPLEIVQAARFVSDTNNLPKLDAQPWDDNVKAVAKVPAVIKMMNDDLQWTMALGETFLAQDKDVLDMIQALRGKAEKAGTLRTTEQQIVVVTNTIVQTTVEQRVVVVTNTIVEIQPVNPQVVYVPTYNPYTVYYPPPAYVYNPYAPLVTFGVGIAVGAAMANHCDYHHGSVYHSGDVDINHNTTINNSNNANVDRSNNVNSGNRGNQATPYNKSGSGQQKWQPDQKRLSSTSRGGATAKTMESRGYGSSSGARPSTQPSMSSRPSTSTGARPSTQPSVGSRPSTSTGARPSAQPSVSSRPTSSPSASSRPSSSSLSSSSSSSRSSGSSAFGGLSSGSSARSSSSRGSSSRSSGGRSGGGRSGGGRR